MRIWEVGEGGGRYPDIISSLTKPTLYFHPGREEERERGYDTACYSMIQQDDVLSVKDLHIPKCMVIAMDHGHPCYDCHMLIT